MSRGTRVPLRGARCPVQKKTLRDAEGMGGVCLGEVKGSRSLKVQGEIQNFVASFVASFVDAGSE